MLELAGGFEIRSGGVAVPVVDVVEQLRAGRERLHVPEFKRALLSGLLGCHARKRMDEVAFVEQAHDGAETFDDGEVKIADLLGAVGSHEENGRRAVVIKELLALPGSGRAGCA